VSPQYLRRSESSLSTDQRARRLRAAEATTQRMAVERGHCDPDMTIRTPECIEISHPRALTACIVASWGVVLLLAWAVAFVARVLL
jgi:hypothetical protein